MAESKEVLDELVALSDIHSKELLALADILLKSLTDVHKELCSIRAHISELEERLQ